MKKRNKQILLCLFFIGVIFMVGHLGGFFNIFDWLQPAGVSHKGPIYFYAEALADQDTTDIDGAGTITFITGNAPYRYVEGALTLGTDTHTTLEYASGDTVWVVWKSTTANAMDHYSYKITLPYGNVAQGPMCGPKALWDIQWSDADENWILMCRGGQEANSPTIKIYNIDGTDVSTTRQDMSDNDYRLELEVKLALDANYDAFFSFFDPEEEEGQWDDFYLIAISNVTAANTGFEVLSPWKKCSNGRDYYLNLREAGYLPGMVYRWDQEEMHGVITVPLIITGADVDTSGTGDADIDITLEECNDNERAYHLTWEADTLENIVTASGTDKVEFGD